MSLHAAEIENVGVSRAPRVSAAELRAHLDLALERVEDDENDAAAWRDIGRLRTLLRIDNDAVTAFERALELDPHMPATLWFALQTHTAAHAARHRC
jgi:hypothetical protein